MSIYLDQDSFIHRLHPVTKIISLLFLFTLPFTLNHPLYLFFLGFGIIGISRAGKILNNIQRIWPFLVGLTIGMVIFIFISGLGLTTWRGSFSGQSLLYGLGMGIRLDMIIFSGLVFFSTTKFEEFIFGLNKLGLPFRLIFFFSMGFRLITNFVDSGINIVTAQQARGLDLESRGLIKRIKCYTSLIIPIFISGLQRNRYLFMALESKGFGARGKRTHYLEFKFTPYDTISLGVLMILNLSCLWLRFRGYGIIE